MAEETSDAKAPLAPAIRELAARARRQKGADVSASEILAFHRGELSGEEMETLRERLALQPEATQALLDLKRFPNIEPVDESRRLGSEDVTGLWQDLRARIDFDSELLLAPSATPIPEPSQRSFRWLAPLAAMLVIAVLGLSAWIASLHRTVRDLSRPQANVVVSSLLPIDQGTTRQQDPPTILELPAGSDRVVLLLNLAELQTYPDYTVEIARATGEVAWQEAGLARMPLGNFTLELPRSYLPPADYRITLYGHDAGQLRPLAAYSVRIL